MFNFNFCTHYLAAGISLGVCTIFVWNWMKRRLYLKLDKKAVLVTGCDSGFGYALTKRLDSVGCQVFAACMTVAGVDRIGEVCYK